MSEKPSSSIEQKPIDPQQRRQNRRAVSGLVLLFALPVILAYVAYQMDWFNMATRNKGTILEKPYPRFEQFSWQDADGNDLHFKDFETQWWWVYFPESDDCDSKCEVNMEFLTRSHLGLGKRAEKLTRLVVFPSQVKYQDRVEKSEQLRLAMGSGQPHLAIKAQSDEPLANSHLELGKIYAMDVHGNIFMRYDAVANAEEAKMKSKDLRDDIVRVMRNTGL